MRQRLTDCFLNSVWHVLCTTQRRWDHITSTLASMLVRTAYMDKAKMTHYDENFRLPLKAGVFPLQKIILSYT